MNLFPEAQLSEAEEIELARVFNFPSVRKYLMMMGQNETVDLVSLSTLDMSADKIAYRHHFIAGKLAVIETLLSISNQPERKQTS